MVSYNFHADLADLRRLKKSNLLFHGLDAKRILTVLSFTLFPKMPYPCPLSPNGRGNLFIFEKNKNKKIGMTAGTLSTEKA